jgi:ATP-binding cassette subfamily B protein
MPPRANSQSAPSSNWCRARSIGIELLVVRNILAAVLAGSPHRDYLPAIEQLVVLVALQTVTGLVSTYTNMQQQLVTELVQRHASRPVTEVATAIGLRDFDTPEFHDRMQRAHRPRRCVRCRSRTLS